MFDKETRNYLCDDDSQCVILKNRRGDTGFVSGETLLAEVGKIYDNVNRDPYEVLEMVKNFMGELPDTEFVHSLYDAVLAALNNKKKLC